MVPSAVINEAVVFFTVLAMVILVRRTSLEKMWEAFRYFTVLSNALCALAALAVDAAADLEAVRVRAPGFCLRHDSVGVLDELRDRLHVRDAAELFAGGYIQEDDVQFLINLKCPGQEEAAVGDREDIPVRRQRPEDVFRLVFIFPDSFAGL